MYSTNDDGIRYSTAVDDVVTGKERKREKEGTP